MKRNAIGRIIIYSLTIIALLAVMLCGICLGQFTYRVDTGTHAYLIGSGSVPSDKVTELEIEWTSGSITIESGNTDTITFQETGTPNAEPMVYQFNGSKLTIYFQAPKVFTGFGTSSGKDLTVTVPRDWFCQELLVDGASADLTVSGLTANTVELNMASASSRFTHCNIYKMDLDSASGEVFYSGTLDILDCDCASGNVTAIFDNIPTEIDFDGASADLDLTLPPQSGFTLVLESLTGDLNTDFEVRRQNRQFICGNGSCNIEVDGISGEITIRKGA